MTYTTEEMKDHAALCASIEAATGGTFEGKSGVIIDILLSRLKALEKENASLKQDAERYRWLRESSDVELWNCLMQTMPFATDLFDRRIDSAMQSEKGDNND